MSYCQTTKFIATPATLTANLTYLIRESVMEDHKEKKIHRTANPGDVICEKSQQLAVDAPPSITGEHI